MPKFLIEVPHEAEQLACFRAIEVFLKSGSHFLTNADWGCMDGEHKAWIIIEAESRENAKSVLPPAFRPQARIIRLCSFSVEEVEENLRHHHSPAET